ncbi:hypothetical protein [Paraburkholderia sp. BL21I4N1]|uniref:hypothetical protein n=1 Tax=Paraburkholderia sp. BL21I4N1 TaxID=1938801 RepID=UPI000CFDE657|nr:hypothetical protein [Paraburkholderia sp. BL21I4N1]PQV53179.1 hypothetical protein B0G83_102264 [Paraburkholderia sp. BL21I4N1]
MNHATRSDSRRPRYLTSVRRSFSAALFASSALLSPLAAHAQMQPQTSAAMTQVCAMRANNAKLIAQDRDAGVSKQDELRKTQAVAAAMPIERQVYAEAELATFVERLYGRYAKTPPQQAYDKYLAYCEGQAARGAAQVQ